jgi:hypothetical protein
MGTYSSEKERGAVRQVWVAAAEPFFYASVVGGGKWSSLFFFIMVLESQKIMG